MYSESACNIHTMTFLTVIPDHVPKIKDVGKIRLWARLYRRRRPSFFVVLPGELSQRVTG